MDDEQADPPGTKYCPMCDRSYPNLEALQAHLKKAQAEGDENHIDIIELEGWDDIPLEEM